mmetsp:Transcript_14711/g.61322  ORF Transcript_14711/g.61322 Transcript_14711/m.61322 type:complete len:285 (-) Transcript_14711:394-1248(-)
MSMPASMRPISVPASAPSSMTSFMSPRCPMRKTFPLTSSRPVPSDRLYLAHMERTMSVVSTPSGPLTTVSELEYHLGLVQSSSRPQAATARRAPSACLAWRATTLSMPSASMRSSCSRRPYSSGMEGVYGKLPSAFILSMSAQLKKTLGSVDVFEASLAFSETQQNDRPVGSDSAFCDPVTTTSTPQSSILNSHAPTLEMPSTMSSAGWPAASIARRTPAMSEVTPVVVSLCTTHTALISPLVSALSAASMRASSAPLPQRSSITFTSSPRRCAWSIQRCEKRP